MQTRWLYDPIRKIAVRSCDDIDEDRIACTHLTMNVFSQVCGNINMNSAPDPMYLFGYPVDEPFVLRGCSFRVACPKMADGFSRAWNMVAPATPEQRNRLLNLPGNGQDAEVRIT